MARISTFYAFLALFSLKILAAEPSAFGAGNLNNPQPYGLTSSERTVLENKNQIHEVVVKSKNQEYKVDSLRERIDGLQSIVESITKSSYQNKIDLKNIVDKNTKELENSYEYEKRLSEIAQKNSLDIVKIQEALDSLKEVVKKIEITYVSKDQFNDFISEFNNFKKLISKEFNNSASTSKKAERSNWDVLKEANVLYEKKNYTQSINNFEYLIEKNFKPAYAHFMIGEINYNRKKFAEAIAYFKKSADLYSKAEYMSTLMLHTAISMELTQDYKNAKVFYNAILSKYPNSVEANTASNNLEAIK